MKPRIRGGGYTYLDVDLFVKRGQEAYYEVERSCQYLVEGTIKRLTEYKAMGKKLYLLSNFYCGKDFLLSWLKELGVSELFDGVFVSCDIGKSKRTGGLYRYVLEQLRLSPKDVLMIGDTYLSDVFMARREGLCAHKVKRNAPKANVQFKREKKYGAKTDELRALFQEFGEDYNYSNYAFPLYLFTKRLCERLEQSGEKEVYFLAREGKILKRLFEIYCAEHGINIKAHYLLASRNSMLMAGLAPIDEEEFTHVLHASYYLTLRRFLITLTFSEEEIETVFRAMNVKRDARSHRLGTTKRFQALKACREFRELYEQKRLSAREGFARYMQQFPNYLQGMSVVDVGWKGGVQDLLCKCLNGKTRIDGYYIGCIAQGDESKRQGKFGLLYDQFAKGANKGKYFHHRMDVYEQILRANHNQVRSYLPKEDGVEVVYTNALDEKSFHEKYIARLQEQIIYKFQKLCRMDYAYGSLMEEQALRAFYQTVSHTSKRDVAWLIAVENTHYDCYARVGYNFAGWKDGVRRFAYALSNGWYRLFAYLPTHKRRLIKKAKK